MIKQMLWKSTEQIQLKNCIFKILQLSTACEDTYVMLIIESQGQDQKLIHLNKKGVIINKYQFYSSVNEFIMVTQQQVILSLLLQNTLISINLLTNQCQKIYHCFGDNALDTYEIYAFSSSKMFCIKQQKYNELPQLVLTYYSYSDFSNNQTPQIVYQSIEGQFSNFNIISKVNNHSKVAWCNGQYQIQQIIVLHEVITSKAGKKQSCVKHIKINNFVHQKLLNSKNCLKIAKMWQIRRGNILIISYPQKNINPYINSQFIQNKFIIKQADYSLKRIKFPFVVSLTQFVANYYFLDSYIVLNSYKCKKGKQAECSIFIVSNQDEQVKLFDHNFVYKNQTKLYFPSYDGNLLIWAQYPNSQVSKINLTKVRPYELKQIYIYFLLHLNQQFDDDILMDALDLLDCI